MRLSFVGIMVGRVFWEPAVRTPEGGASGVAILARSFLGLHLPTHIFAGRALGAMAHLSGGAQFCLVSFYGFDSEGLSDRQLELLNEVGRHASVVGKRGLCCRRRL